jgi:hypothetical protein
MDSLADYLVLFISISSGYAYFMFDRIDKKLSDIQKRLGNAE